jgi:putative oxidoreductase
MPTAREQRRAAPEEMHGDEPGEAGGHARLDQRYGNASPPTQSPRKVLAKARPGRGSDRHAVGTGRTPPRFRSACDESFFRPVETAISPAASYQREGSLDSDAWHALLKEIKMIENLDGDRWRQWVPIPIRVIIGVGFMIHGWAKWSRGPAAFAELLGQVGVPLPLAQAWLVTLLEIFGGLAVLMGAFITTTSIPLILSMLGAMFTVNIKYGFSAVNTVGLTSEGPQFGPPGYEINLLYIAGLVALILGGAGPLSIDALRKRRRHIDPRRTRSE